MPGRRGVLSDRFNVWNISINRINCQKRRTNIVENHFSISGLVAVTGSMQTKIMPHHNRSISQQLFCFESTIRLTMENSKFYFFSDGTSHRRRRACLASISEHEFALELMNSGCTSCIAENFHLSFEQTNWTRIFLRSLVRSFSVFVGGKLITVRCAVCPLMCAHQFCVYSNENAEKIPSTHRKKRWMAAWSAWMCAIGSDSSSGVASRIQNNYSKTS